MYLRDWELSSKHRPNGAVMTKVFVYGTLRNDYPGSMAGYLRRFAEFKERARLDNYALYDMGGFPCVTYSEGDKCYGHVFDGVSPEVLDRLDSYEGYPIHYNRERVIVNGDGGNTHECLVYTYSNPPGRGTKVEEWNIQR
jgi:gamma-glutamylcyclotransferase (GGCT)/AIG2-like uncharacterized protein YtfP